ncbi:MAG: hypothetical protein WKH64_14015 [Chloroflexia bacterium]
MRYRQAVEGDMRELAEMRWEFHYEDEPDSPEERRSEFVRECESFLREGLLGGRWVVWLAEDGESSPTRASTDYDRSQDPTTSTVSTAT